MNNAFTLLELDSIRQKVAQFAKSAEAERLLLAEDPAAHIDNWKTLRKNVEYIFARFSSEDMPPSAFIPDISEILPVLDVAGNALSLEEVFALGIFLIEGNALLEWLRYPVFLELNIIEKEIFRIIDKDGKLRDLPELREIKKRIARTENELQSILKKYCTESAAYLQSDIPSERDGRAVLLLKANHKGKIKGIVREVSATGQTLFVEPDEVVEKNNALVIEKRNYDIEVRRILFELTKKINGQSETLRAFHDKIIELETYRAKAAYSISIKGIFAETSANGALALKNARHPLLGEKAVPIDFEMGASCAAAVITGPNTGGKTVMLKTAGLFALMNQLGLALPAAAGTQLPFFNAVYADIGDDQSISESLSTFSAHIKNISFIINNAAENSLVLLDELGSGTDPLEGGAIAMAVANYFVSKKIKTLITTHHGVLKNYAYTHSGVENASVEFDEASLLPTYRIVMGIPGESRALLIAEKYSLPSEIVREAKQYIESGAADVSALINALNEKHLEVEKIKKELIIEKKELLNEKRKADLRELQLRQKELEIKKAQYASLTSFAAESRRKLENLVKELREGEITREKTLNVKQFIAALESDVENFSKKIDAEDGDINRSEISREDYRAESYSQLKQKNTAGDFSAGAPVYVSARHINGVIKRQVKKGYYAVEIGSVTVTLPQSELIPCAQKSAPTRAFVSVELEKSRTPAFELNLLGLRSLAAIEELRAQLDSAVLSGLQSFAVIHGKGDGLLARAVHEYLKTRSEVADFHFSRPELGGFGRTEVTLK